MQIQGTFSQVTQHSEIIFNTKLVSDVLKITQPGVNFLCEICQQRKLKMAILGGILKLPFSSKNKTRKARLNNCAVDLGV